MAAVAGGITSYMEMPNTIPNATNINELEKNILLLNKNHLLITLSTLEQPIIIMMKY